jgi:excisionase family DNA binding protein
VTTREAAERLGCSKVHICRLVKAGVLRIAEVRPDGSFRFDRDEVEQVASARDIDRAKRAADRDEQAVLGIASRREREDSRHQLVFDGSEAYAVEQRASAQLTEKIADLTSAVEHLTFRVGALDQLRADDHEDVRALKKRVDTQDTWLAVLGGAEVAALLLDTRVQAKIREVFAALTSTPSADAPL